MRTTQIAPRPRRFGFTLVELLVVIGIIALLISILLPSLAKARASAVSLDCAARMRTIGQAMNMYASQYKGMLPAASNYVPEGSGWNVKRAANMLSEVLGTQEWAINPVFHDKDVIEPDAGAAVGSSPYNGSPGKLYDGVICHYSPSARLFPVTAPPGGTSTAVPERHYSGGFDGSLQSAYRNLGDIRNSSECAAFWDACQVAWGGSTGKRAYPAWYTSDGTSHWGWHSWGNRFVSIDNQAGSGYLGNDSIFVQNDDTGAVGSWSGQGGVRFRHMQNTVANILFADGHVDSRTYNKSTTKSNFLVRELGTSYKPYRKLP